MTLGPTGEFPDGKLSPDDHGEIQLAIGATRSGHVLIHFGKSISWLGMSPDEAKDFARQLIKASNDARKQDAPKLG